MLFYKFKIVIVNVAPRIASLRPDEAEGMIGGKLRKGYQHWFSF